MHMAAAARFNAVSSVETYLSASCASSRPNSSKATFASFGSCMYACMYGCMRACAHACMHARVCVKHVHVSDEEKR